MIDESTEISCSISCSDVSDILPMKYETLDRMHSSPFIIWDDFTIAEIHKRVEAMDLIAQERLSNQLKGVAGYTVELAPLAIRRQVFDMIEQASNQWLRATVSFLKDVYSSSSPLIVQAYPELRHMLDTSPQYCHEIVGSQMAQNESWDIAMAMDWQLVKNSDSTFSVKILEGGPGSVGGLERIAFVAHAIEDAWGQVAGYDRFEDGTQAVKQMIEKNCECAQKLGGIAVNYQEQDQPEILGQNALHPFRIWLEAGRTPLISNWNKDELHYDVEQGYYYFQGQKVTCFWLQYFPSALDPTMESYKRLGQIYKTEYELTHVLPRFWQRYVFEGGYQRWRVFNPIGCEVLGDKALIAYLPQIIKFYLNEEPLIKSTHYHYFINASGELDKNRLNQVFSAPEQWVVKSRIDNIKGIGVFVGSFMLKGRKQNGLTWEMLRTQVERMPALFVYQPFFHEETVKLPGNRYRSFEVRNIGWTFNGKVNTVGIPYVRSCSPGAKRNLSGQTDSSIIPVLVPK